jgi:hypothetical protein
LRRIECAGRGDRCVEGACCLPRIGSISHLLYGFAIINKVRPKVSSRFPFFVAAVSPECLP